jgi:hypothetical protein
MWYSTSIIIYSACTGASLFLRQSIRMHGPASSCECTQEGGQASTTVLVLGQPPTRESTSASARWLLDHCFPLLAFQKLSAIEQIRADQIRYEQSRASDCDVQYLFLNVTICRYWGNQSINQSVATQNHKLSI